MAIRIRLARHGAKKRPFYRIVVANSTCKRDGRFIEIVGTYDPARQSDMVTLKEDKLAKWLSRGAQPTPTVASLLKKRAKTEAAAGESA